jgi:multiple sugar transport system permease protein
MDMPQPAVAIGQRLGATRPRLKTWHGGLFGSDHVWAVAFAIPYVIIFLLFVIYPICYGFYLGGDPHLYSQLFADPRYGIALVNTLIYVGLGVNLHIFCAFLLSGFFMRKGWWVKALLVAFILPWATPSLPAFISLHWFFDGQYGLLNNLLYWLFGIDGPVYLNSRWLGTACNIAAYCWKYMPFWTVIFLAGRMAIPQELYEAAEVDGATGLARFTNVTWPLMAHLYLVCTLLSTIFSLGEFNAVYFVSGGGPNMSTEVLATLGIRYAYTLGLPRLGVAEVLTALPVLVPLVLVLMRKLRMSERQL